MHRGAGLFLTMSLPFSPRGFSLFFLMIYVATLPSVATPRKVLTKQGYVKGLRQTIQTYDGKTKTIYKFLGVPYAEKPIGDLRFKPPQPPNQRQGIYQAKTFRSICTQPDHYFESVKEAWPEFDPEKDVDEDCLYLNIYTPSTTGKKKYPVVFYIHGGSYVGGTPVREGSPGEFLPTRGVVLVTVQYRLGIFGFFSTGDSEAPGNLGLFDQVEALKWVQENIHAFGGDKDKVTLLGESAGGSSVSLHFLSPLSKGFFHRGIAVSGVDLSPFAITPKPKVLDASKLLIKNLNCTGANSNEILRCVQSIPKKTVTENIPFQYLFHLQPYIDNHFLRDDPMKLQKEGAFHKLPLMSGFVSQECSFLLQNKPMSDYDKPGFEKYLKGFLQQEFQRSEDEAPVAYNALEFQYTPWGDQNNGSAFREKLIEMMTDRVMIAPTHEVLTLRSDHGAPTYMFEFTHRSQYSPKAKWMGVVHEDTTAYKFGLPLFNTDLTKLKFDDVDKKVSEMTVTMFLNFVKFGNPTPSPVYGTRWDTFTSSNNAYLKIQKKPVMTSKYHPLRMAFWNTYFPSLLPEKSKPSGEESVSSDEAMDHGKGEWFPVFW